MLSDAVDCLPGVYHHASARLLAFLTDAPSEGTLATPSSTLTSLTPSVVSVSDDRATLIGHRAGTARIRAAFGGATTNASLTVSDEASRASRLNWHLPNRGATFCASVGATYTPPTQLRYTTPAGGSLTYSLKQHTPGGVALQLLVNYSSQQPAALSVSTRGTLTIYDNAHTEVRLMAATVCSPTTVFDSKLLWANLYTAEMDVDLGFGSGQQFKQPWGSTTLPVQVQIRPLSGYFMTSFMLKIGALDTTILSSDQGRGASWTDAALYPGIQVQLGDPPSEVVLAAYHPSSTQQEALVLGTVSLAIVSSGATLLEGIIQSLLVCWLSGRTTLVV